MFNSVKERAAHNLSVIENFILYFTHYNRDDAGVYHEFKSTPKIMYQAADEYIQEDHVDGLERDEAPADKYRIVTATSAAELQRKVAQLQDEGWCTDGPHQVVPKRSYDQYSGNQHRGVQYEYEYSQTLTH